MVDILVVDERLGNAFAWFVKKAFQFFGILEKIEMLIAIVFKGIFSEQHQKS